MELFPSKKAKTPEIPVGGVPTVNLMPRSFTSQREQSKLFKAWGIRIALAVTVVAGICAALIVWRSTLLAQLGDAQAETERITAEIAANGDIGGLVEQQEQLDSFRTEVMATDLSWGAAMAIIKSQLPEGANIGSFSLTMGGAPTGDPEGSVGLFGQISIAPEFGAQIPWLERIEPVDGVLRLAARHGLWDDTVKAYFSFIDIALDQTIYGSVNPASPAEPAPVPEPVEDPADTPDAGASPDPAGDESDTVEDLEETE